MRSWKSEYARYMREQNLDGSNKASSYIRALDLLEYHRCYITGIPIPEVLRASHIIPWSEDEANRMNPANGLCLSATYEAAFDRFLISFDEDYRMIPNPALADHLPNEAFQRHFKNYDGQRITLPHRFLPDKTLLARHREWITS